MRFAFSVLPDRARQGNPGHNQLRAARLCPAVAAIQLGGTILGWSPALQVAGRPMRRSRGSSSRERRPSESGAAPADPVQKLGGFRIAMENTMRNRGRSRRGAPTWSSRPSGRRQKRLHGHSQVGALLPTPPRPHRGRHHARLRAFSRRRDLVQEGGVSLLQWASRTRPSARPIRRRLHYVVFQIASLTIATETAGRPTSVKRRKAAASGGVGVFPYRRA